MNTLNRAVRASTTLRNKGVKHISIFLNENKQMEKNYGGYVPVYKFPYIRHLALINRLKLYQTIVTVTAVPSSVILKQMDCIGLGNVELIAAVGVSGCICLYTLGYITTKFVGFIYYNEEKDMTKIAYTDFWGRRKDIEIPARDIVPLSELPVTPTDGLFVTIRSLSTKETFRLNLKFGIVLDQAKMKKIL